MRMAILLACATLLVTAVESNAAQLVKRTCTTDSNGTRTCTEYFADGRSRPPKTDRIMGMPAKKYMQGVKSGKCMPTPSGACGGG